VNLLLDTQALIWWREGNRKLGPRARTTIEKHAATVRVSAATAWEIAIKSRGGRLRLREPLHVWMPAALESSGFGMLHVTIDHAIAVANLPDHHGDPFDRLLIAQARMEGLTIVTSDAAFGDYDVKLLDARA
jgi:PIN domain nuclease of toxin-antitoxin system